MYVVDFTDPSAYQPAAAGSVATDLAFDVAVDGDWAYVTHTSPPGLSVFDIRDPTHPVHETTVSTSTVCYRVSLAGDRAYVGESDGGFLVFDISDPTSPALAASDPSLSYTIGARVAGDRAMVFDETGLHFYEVLPRTKNLEGNVGQSLPAPLPVGPRAEITEVRLLATETGSVDWEISATDGLHWQPIVPEGTWHTVTHPGLALVWRATLGYEEAGAYPVVTAVFLESNDVGVGIGDVGVVPTVFALHGAAPNPFRGGTRVVFDLPADAVARLAVYDVTGRLEAGADRGTGRVLRLR
jgi:hypothetical protein